MKRLVLPAWRSPFRGRLRRPSRSAWSPRCRASRRWPARRSRAACSVAIDEINAKGGLLGGRKLELVRRDDEANPAKGVIAARELIFKEKVAVLFGGLDTPVSMAIVPLVNQEKVPFMGPWAAGTAITKNGANPNFAFRVSAVDEIVDTAMLQYAQKTFKRQDPGMILVNNPWGESNEKGLKAALAAKGMKAVGIEKFEGNDVDVVPQLTRLKAAGADALFLVGNVGPSAQVVKSLDRMGWKVPVVSHWGPAGGRFTELAGPSAKRALRADLQLLRQAVADGREGDQGADGQVPGHQGPGRHHAAVGVANAYDAHAARRAGDRDAGSTDGDAVRQGFYKIGELRRPDQDVRQAVHAGRRTTRSARTTTSGRSSSTTASCRWA